MLKLTLPFTNKVIFNSTHPPHLQADSARAIYVNESLSPLEISVQNLLADDISVFIIALKCPESVLINIEMSGYARVMSFTLSGILQVQTIRADAKPMPLVEKTYHSLLPPAKAQKDIIIKGEAKLFVVGFTAGVINKLVPADEQKLWKNTGARNTLPDMDDLIYTTISGTENNSLHRIMLAAKMLELLFLDLHLLKNNIATTPSRTGDLQKLELARVIIADNIQSPCSLIELAHKVGLNDFKLKKGFKETYGTTVFGYLADLRMEKAKRLLSSAQYTVSEVAHEIGYKNAHHFSAAYKKKFGHVPSKTGQL